jgi:hypothetical protein
MTGRDEDARPETPQDGTSPDTTEEQDKLAEAAAEGPLPGIADDADSDAGDQEPIGRRPHDEAKEAIGFMGTRSS